MLEERGDSWFKLARENKANFLYPDFYVESFISSYIVSLLIHTDVL